VEILAQLIKRTTLVHRLPVMLFCADNVNLHTGNVNEMLFSLKFRYVAMFIIVYILSVFHM
jgi:hypothetical protein